MKIVYLIFPATFLTLLPGCGLDSPSQISCVTHHGFTWNFYVTKTSIGDLDGWPDSKMNCEVTETKYDCERSANEDKQFERFVLDRIDLSFTYDNGGVFTYGNCSLSKKKL